MSENEESKFDLKLLAMGVVGLVGAIVLGLVSWFSWTGSGEVLIMLPIGAVVLLVMGGGAIIKAIGGDAIEWD